MQIKTAKASDAVIRVLRHSTFIENKLYLPENLDRALYTQVMKHVELMGGKWHRSSKCHVFPEGTDAGALMLPTIEDGATVDKKKTLQAFLTPPDVAEKAVSYLDCKGYLVLEPSAGRGALVAAALAAGAQNVVCIEIDADSASDIRDRFPNTFVLTDDFLARTTGMFHRIVMNPPFDRNTWKKHIEKACMSIDTGGILVAITPDQDFDLPGFRTVVVERLERAFTESGTNVATRIIQITRK